MKYTQINVPPHIFAVRFTDSNAQSLTDLCNSIETQLIERLEVDTTEGSFNLAEQLKCTTAETIRLENGAEAYFVRAATQSSKQPLVVMIHGGPFSCFHFSDFVPF